MWRNLLTGLGAPAASAELFALDEPEKDAVLRFRALDLIALPRGVPDDLWRSSEPEAPANDGQGRLAL
jgi:hypothetical protein